MAVKYTKTSRGGKRIVYSQTKNAIYLRKRYQETGRRPGRPRKYTQPGRRLGHHFYPLHTRNKFLAAKQRIY